LTISIALRSQKSITNITISLICLEEGAENEMSRLNEVTPAFHFLVFSTSLP